MCPCTLNLSSKLLIPFPRPLNISGEALVLSPQALNLSSKALVLFPQALNLSSEAFILSIQSLNLSCEAQILSPQHMSLSSYISPGSPSQVEQYATLAIPVFICWSRWTACSRWYVTLLRHCRIRTTVGDRCQFSPLLQSTSVTTMTPPSTSGLGWKIGVATLHRRQKWLEISSVMQPSWKV